MTETNINMTDREMELLDKISKLEDIICKLVEEQVKMSSKLDKVLEKINKSCSSPSSGNYSNLDTLPVKYESLYRKEDHDFLLTTLSSELSLRSVLNLIVHYYIDIDTPSLRVHNGKLLIWGEDNRWYSSELTYGRILIKNIIKLFRKVNDFKVDCDGNFTIFQERSDFISSLDTKKNHSKILKDIKKYLTEH